MVALTTSSLNSFLSFAHCRAASTVIPPLPKAIFTSAIDPNLGLPSTRPSLTSAINTLIAIRCSSILSTCPNHFNTLWSALLANSLFIQSLLRTSSFLTLSVRHTPTKLLKHFKEHSLSFSQHLSYPMPSLFHTTPLQLDKYFFAFIPNPLVQHTFQRSSHSLPLIHSVFQINITSSIRCHLEPLVLKT